MSDEELERLARAATPGPWRWVNPENDEPRSAGQYQSSLRTVAMRETRYGPMPEAFILDTDEIRDEKMEENANFIEAFDPTTVLALLERVKKAEARVREVEGGSPAAQQWCERPVRDSTGRLAGPCSLESGHEDTCEHWLGGRHPKPIPR